MAILKKKQTVAASEEQQDQQEKKAPTASAGMRDSVAHTVLLRPMLSEKTTGQEAQGQYTFVVERGATKDAIKQAVKDVYGVSPSRVNVIHVDGKLKRFGRFTGRRSDFKKAIVTLPKGQKIEIHEGV